MSGNCKFCGQERQYNGTDSQGKTIETCLTANCPAQNVTDEASVLDMLTEEDLSQYTNKSIEERLAKLKKREANQKKFG